MGALSFLLDTDAVSFALRGEGRVGERIRAHARSELGMSSVTLAELRFGAELRHSKKLHGLIDIVIAELRVVPFDAAAADAYAGIAARLRSRGRPIGMADAMLAGHAKSLGCTMVTRNVRHFARVAGLRVEDWY